MSNRYFFLARAAARHVANMSRDSRELRTTNGWDLFSVICVTFFVYSACCTTSRPGTGHSKKSGRGRCGILFFLCARCRPPCGEHIALVWRSLQINLLGFFFATRFCVLLQGITPKGLDRRARRMSVDKILRNNCDKVLRALTGDYTEVCAKRVHESAAQVQHVQLL